MIDVQTTGERFAHRYKLYHLAGQRVGSQRRKRIVDSKHLNDKDITSDTGFSPNPNCLNPNITDGRSVAIAG